MKCPLHWQRWIVNWTKVDGRGFNEEELQVGLFLDNPKKFSPPVTWPK